MIYARERGPACKYGAVLEDDHVAHAEGPGPLCQEHAQDHDRVAENGGRGALMALIRWKDS
eukprot:17169-Prymnesium_polylepis.1